MDLQTKAKHLWELRQKIAEMEKAIEPFQQERDTLQQEIMQGFKELGTATMRYDFATLSLAVRKTPQVIDEPKVIAWLQKNKLAKEYTAVRLAPHFSTLMKESVKEGRTIDGVEIRESEYMSITSAKEGDKRKVSTE